MATAGALQGQHLADTRHAEPESFIETRSHVQIRYAQRKMIEGVDGGKPACAVHAVFLGGKR
jgi:hypothetical protein